MIFSSVELSVLKFNRPLIIIEDQFKCIQSYNNNENEPLFCDPLAQMEYCYKLTVSL